MDYISREDAIRWVKTECNPYGKPTLDFESGKEVIAHLEQMPSADVVERNTLQHTQCVESVKNALDVEERKVNKISDLEFLYEEFKNVPNFVCGDCECDGAPGIMMKIPIEDKEIVLYFDFYGNLCKGGLRCVIIR